MVLTSYAACFGSCLINGFARSAQRCQLPPMKVAQIDGSFNDLGRLDFASIRDGLSHTLFVAERSTSAIKAVADRVTFPSPDPGWFVSGNIGATLFLTFYPPNVNRKVSLAAGSTFSMAATSNHPGGLNALMGDGSVRFIKETVQSWPYDARTGTPEGATLDPGRDYWVNLPPAGIWQALGTRAGGETTPDF